jgi:hypothetical protein
MSVKLVLVEQNFSTQSSQRTTLLATLSNKTGSAQEHGVASGSTATVISVDGNKNILTVEIKDGEGVAYNPAQLRRLTAESTGYTKETRDLPKGERIQFTQSDKEHRIRSGNFETVEQIADDNGLTVSLDNGKSFELTRSRQSLALELRFSRLHI